MNHSEGENKYLRPMLASLPYFRALLRAVEGEFYGDFELVAPVLDLGCGDGLFAYQVFVKPIDVGIDPALVSLREAKNYGAYRLVLQSFGDRLPFADGYFASAFSNSVLEHIPGLQDVLNETARVMKKDGLFLFCVPNHRWPGALSISGALNGIGLHRLAAGYTRMFTRISRHVNMLSPEEWYAKLAEAGFRVERYWHYFPPAALHSLEWGHCFGLPSWATRLLTGRWILAPAHWNLALTERLVRKHAEGGANAQGVYTWYAARRN